ncbi:MAG: molybdopterin-dependent oxidoreductase [Verrucomicrobiales bacterium]|nr:molybdopterin-dependent oxidoreductase [Verrucomicrobiales bacterium]
MKDSREMMADELGLQAVLLTSPHASAALVGKSLGKVAEVEGFVAAYFCEDVEGSCGNSLFAESKVEYVGQAVALIVAATKEACHEAIEKIEVDYHSTPAVLDVVHAQAVRSLQGGARCLRQGDAVRGLEDAEVLLQGSLSVGSQYPLSGGLLIAHAVPLDEISGGGMEVRVPAENLDEVRTAVSQVTGLSESRVRVIGMDLAGSSGGRGQESIRIAQWVAFATMKTGRAVSLELDRKQEAALTGKRHAVEAKYKVGCDESGVISALEIDLHLDSGAEDGCAVEVLERLLLSVDGAYGIENFCVKGSLCRTHALTGKSIWAEGSAQGVFVIEAILASVARRLGKSVESVREQNFYRASKSPALTPYGQEVDAALLSRLWIASLASAEFYSRRQVIEQWNQKNHAAKRGIAAVPIKIGVGDVSMGSHQASAWLQIYGDGSAQVRLGVVDLGEGLCERVRRQVSEFFQLEEKLIAVSGGQQTGEGWGDMLSPYGTAAQELMAEAVRDACEQVDQQMGECSVESEGESFAERIAQARRKGAKLTAVGFHRQTHLTDGALPWSDEKMQMKVFDAYFYGVAVVEIELDAFSGEVQVLRADLFAEGKKGGLEDWQRAQILRAYMMGQGWVLNEDVKQQPYAVPGLAQAPADFAIELLDLEGQESEGLRTTLDAQAAVAMAVAVREAVQEALLAYAPGLKLDVGLPLPAGPVEVMRALREVTEKVTKLKLEQKKSGGKP